MTDTPETDLDLRAQIDRALWHVSPGYVAPDGQQVGPHEYILVHEYPELWDRIYQRIKAPDAYFGTYNANKRRFRYVDLGIYKYWAFRFVLNRERLPHGDNDPVAAACRNRVTFGDRDHAARSVRRVTARTRRDYYTFACDRGCGGWHVSPFGSPRW